MKFYDTFLFNSELDMLECRLVQFDEWPVYRHVLVEAPVDHQGHPKPLYYADNRERFAPWADRITHVITGKLSGMTDAGPFEREAAQRDAAAAGLHDADGDDHLILADVDEIPNTRAMEAVLARQAGVLEMTCCAFAADWVLGPLRTSVLCPASAGGPLSQIRRAGWEWPRIPGAGHHLTWMGGQAGIAAKLAAHCHTEINAAMTALNDAGRLHETGVNPFGQYGYPAPSLTPAEVDHTWPRYVRNRLAGRKPCCPENWLRPRPQGRA